MNAVSYLTAFVYMAGSIVCHQIPERSFHINGVQFPVCARCTGLYVGGLVGVMLWLLRRDRAMTTKAARVALVGAAIPTMFTLVTAQLAWWDPMNAVRAGLAAPLGVVVGAVVTAGLTRNLR